MQKSMCKVAVKAMGGSIKSLLPRAAGQRAYARIRAEAYARIRADKINNEMCSNFYTLLLKQDTESQDKGAEKILNGLRDFDKECKGPLKNLLWMLVSYLLASEDT